MRARSRSTWALLWLLTAQPACDLLNSSSSTPPSALDFAVLPSLFPVHGPHGTRYEFSMWLPEGCKMQRNEGYEISYSCASDRWQLEVLSLPNFETEVDLEATLRSYLDDLPGELKRLQPTVGAEAPGLNYLHVDDFDPEGVRTGVITANTERSLILVIQGRFADWRLDPEVHRMRGSFSAAAEAKASVGEATIHQRGGHELGQLADRLQDLWDSGELNSSGTQSKFGLAAVLDDSPWASEGQCIELEFDANQLPIAGRVFVPDSPMAHELGYRVIRDQLVLAADSSELDKPNAYYEQVSELGDHAESFGYDESKRPVEGQYQLIFSRCGAVVQLGAQRRDDDALQAAATVVDQWLKAQLCTAK